MQVKECFAGQEFTPFIRMCINAGSAMERAGWELKGRTYSQGAQTFTFEKGEFSACLEIEPLSDKKA